MKIEYDNNVLILKYLRVQGYQNRHYQSLNFEEILQI